MACCFQSQEDIPIPKPVGTYARSFPHTTINSPCLMDVSRRLLLQLAASAGVQIVHVEGNGRLGRIYRLTDGRILKVSSVRDSGTLETHNYSILHSRGISCPRIDVSMIQVIEDQQYTVTVMERLEFTLTALLRTGYMCQSLLVDLDKLLDALQAAKVVYRDLSPDNIMFRKVGDARYSLCVIDPQFVVVSDNIDDFDRKYLSLKIIVLGMVHRRSMPVCRKVCQFLLGYVPPRSRVVWWLQHARFQALPAGPDGPLSTIREPDTGQ